VFFRILADSRIYGAYAGGKRLEKTLVKGEKKQTQTLVLLKRK